MSEAKQWLREAAQRIADHNDGTWCSKSWRIIADAFELVGDDPDGKLDLVAVMFDEIISLRQRLVAAEAALVAAIQREQATAMELERRGIATANGGGA